MGEKDLEVLYQIYKEATKHHFYFKYDAGKFETAIEFISDGRFFHPPIAHNWEESKDKGTEIKCPDLLEWNNKLVIEYEEETGNKRLGAKFARKGHGHEGDLDKERDDNRNKLYLDAGLKLFRIWESNYKDGSWKEKLKSWLNSVEDDN